MTALIPTGSGYYNPSRVYGSYTSGSAVQADMTYSQASDIVIHTLEGDTVTLSSSTYNAGGYETYESLALGKGGFAYQYGERAYFESHQQISITVTGDLNHEELEDVNSILDTLNEMMNDLTAGNLESAISRSSEFTGIDAIASFSADLNITATLSTSRVETASAVSSAPGSWNRHDNATSRIDQMADGISSMLKTRPALLERLVPKIDSSFSDWMETSPIETNDQSKNMKWAKRFAQRLMDALKPGMPSDGE